MVSERRVPVLLLVLALSTFPFIGTTLSDNVAGGGGGGGGGGAAPPFYYRVTNGGTTEVLQALVDGRSAVDFYGYSSGDSSSHTGYEESQTLSIFLWSGPEGKSLVFMADEANDGSGGALKVAIAGMPAGAFWSVKDDPGDTYTATSAHWRWINCCTDGGVMDLATDDAVALNLTFPIVSGLSSFRLFGGPASNPQYVTFDPNQPLVIETFQTPGAPGLAATTGPGAGEVTLDATPPEDDGGDPITSYHFYQETSTDVYNWIGSSETTDFVTSGLDDGTSYTFIALAANRGGLGNASEPVDVATLAPPGPVQDFAVTAGPGAGELTLTWGPPLEDGGAPVLGYHVLLHGDSLGNLTSGFVHSGLEGANAYTYEIRAHNLVGEGGSTIATGITFTRPSEPLNVTVMTVPEVGTLDVTWDAPVGDGGLPVTAYHVYRDGALVATVAPGEGFLDTGLQNGTTYTYAVSAENEVGESLRSIAADGTTAAVPDAPRDLVVSSDGAVGTTDLSWLAPAVDGGAPVTFFTVYAGDSPETLSPVAEVTGVTYQDQSPDPVPIPAARHYAVSATNVVGEGPLTAASCGVHAPYGSLTGLLCG